MKTSVATSLSIIGVLATGGIAMAVNTTVLNSSIAAVDGTPVLAEAYVPVTSLSDGSAVPVVPTSSGETATGFTDYKVESDSVQTSYDVEGTGVVTLLQSDSGLTVVSVDPISGWTYNSKSEDSNRVEIDFTNGTQRTEFRAELIDGRIVTAVESTDSSITSPSNHNDGESSDDHNGEESEVGDDD